MFTGDTIINFDIPTPGVCVLFQENGPNWVLQA